MVPPFNTFAAGELPLLVELSHDELLGVLRAATAVRRQAEARVLHVVTEIDARTPELVSDNAHGSMRSLLVDECRVDGGIASRTLMDARSLRSLPQAAEALAAGEIDPAHLREIHRGVLMVPEEIKTTIEDALLTASRNCPPADVRALAGRLFEQHRPGGLNDEEQDAYARRAAYLNTVAGRSYFNAAGDLEGGALLDAVLRPLMGKRDEDDLRTLPQQRYDALMEACRRLLDSDTLPDFGGGRPHLTLVADVRTPSGAEGALPAQLAGPAGWNPISRDAFLELCCDVKLCGAAFDGPLEKLDWHRDVRTVTPAQKRALAVRDGGCRVRGCHRPPEYCIAHHILWWEEGGPTDLANLVLLCSYHHRLIHRKGWRIEGHPDDALAFISPNERVTYDANPRRRT